MIPEARGRGYGRMLVTRGDRAGREGGHELTFIVADDNDWPKQLYGRSVLSPWAGPGSAITAAAPAAA